jgi:hypothetical protein
MEKKTSRKGRKDGQAGQKGRPSLHDRAKKLCGSLSGPTDLSTRKLRGYGRE